MKLLVYRPLPIYNYFLRETITKISKKRKSIYKTFDIYHQVVIGKNLINLQSCQQYSKEIIRVSHRNLCLGAHF